MTARIVGFVSRADCGLRGPKSVSRNITPERGGSAPHYGGPKQSAAEPGADHARCIATWRNWQKYHMDTKGWADIAYTGGFCNHGYAFAGRGVGVRTAANGTNAGNQNYYAFTWIGGEGQTPTQEALDAADWWVVQLRKAGAGRAVKPHRFFKATGCPGDPLVGYAASRDGKDADASAPAPEPTKPPAPAPKPKPKPKPTSGDDLVFPVLKVGSRGQHVRNLQGLLHAAGRNPGPMDGIYGTRVRETVIAYQRAAGIPADGMAGTQTFRTLLGV